MISILGGKAMAAMQRKTAELEMQVEALSLRLTSTTDQLAVIGDQLAMAIGQLEVQAAGMIDAEQRVAVLTGIVADHAARIARLDEQEERRQELDRQVRTSMIRIERQAMIDVTELRQTSLTLAERLLAIHGRSAGAQAAATE